MDELHEGHVGEHHERDLPIVEGDRRDRLDDDLSSVRTQLVDPAAEIGDEERLVVVLHALSQPGFEHGRTRQCDEQLESRAGAHDEAATDPLSLVAEIITFGRIAQQREGFGVFVKIAAGHADVMEGELHPWS